MGRVLVWAFDYLGMFNEHSLEGRRFRDSDLEKTEGRVCETAVISARNLRSKWRLTICPVPLRN